MLKMSSNANGLVAYVGQKKGQMEKATASMLNQAAFAVRRALIGEMRQKFKPKPTPFMERSMWVDQASVARPWARVYPRSIGDNDPAAILAPHVFGGSRSIKRSERRLMDAGILPRGYYIAPGAAAPLDRYGNIRGGFVVRLLSYLRAFSEVGSLANMNDKRRDRLAKRKRVGGFINITGVQYFVAYGRLRDGRGKHLAPGIYERRGTHGVRIRPVIMFVRKPRYAKRLRWIEAANDAIRSTLRSVHSTVSGS